MQYLALLLSSLALTQALPSSPAGSRTLPARDVCTTPSQQEDGCYTYCNTVTSEVNGPAQSASARITCDVATCAVGQLSSVTITEGYSVTSGLSVGPISDSATFTWSKAVQSADTYTFNLDNGDDGYVMFTPLLHQVCGDLKRYAKQGPVKGGFVPLEHSGGLPPCPGTIPAGTQPTGEDPNACGTSASVLSDGNANGDFTFCATNGTGCKPLQAAQGMKRSARSVRLTMPQFT